MRKHFTKQLAAVVALLFSAGTVTAATVIYQDNFDGTSADLNGTTPDVGANNWVAETGFNADGSVTGGGAGSATLAFTPVDGLIYTLDVSLGASAYNAPPDNDWFALGFASGQNAGTSSGNRFINNNIIGKAWMLARGPAPILNNGLNRTWLGTATSGTQNGLDWSDQTTLFGGNADLRIVLDTTGGAGNWNATFFAKGTADGSYSVVRATEDLADETINSVGIARSGPDITGSITSFSLTSEVPEPSSLALMGLGSLLIARRRRG